MRIVCDRLQPAGDRFSLRVEEWPRVLVVIEGDFMDGVFEGDFMDGLNRFLVALGVAGQDYKVVNDPSGMRNWLVYAEVELTTCSKCRGTGEEVLFQVPSCCSHCKSLGCLTPLAQPILLDLSQC